FIIIPVYALFIASFKPGELLLQYGLNLNPEFEKMGLSNYQLLFSGTHDYWIWFVNSIFLTVVTVLLTLLVSAFVAYGFVAYDFKGKNILFVAVLAIMSVPFEVVMLPLYKQMSDWHLMDSYVAIVLPFLAHSSTIFFFRQYLLGLPKSLIEAGRIDGASEFGIFFRVIMPMMRPAFAAMAILNGMNAWNNYMGPLLVIRSSNKYTLTLGLNTLINPYGDNYSLLIVGAFFSIIPIFILFVAFQRYFIEGMTAGAVKE
ncbi:MAG: carbohydrate ABC transporter permease, partial [Lachnospiraceae bacterium]|nr:carbohydrate ABC transporter permease [Lachnospiraceae bacterium]